MDQQLGKSKINKIERQSTVNLQLTESEKEILEAMKVIPKKVVIKPNTTGRASIASDEIGRTSQWIDRIKQENDQK